jgi:hypothetical protein
LFQKLHRSYLDFPSRLKGNPYMPREDVINTSYSFRMKPIAPVFTKYLSAVSKNRFSLFLLVLALIVGGVGAQATGLLNTQSGGYLVCVNTSTKVVTHPGTSRCPKGNKKLVLGAQGAAGAIGLTGATGLSGKDGRDGIDGKTLWNGVTDPASTWGAPGDMYINSVTKTLFGPKDLTAGWPKGVSMVGPKGDQGPIGLTGATGAQGPSGGSGPAGPAGATGPAGPAGTNGTSASLTCAEGGTCALGDTGPGGGIVFIVQTPTAAAPWRYMEVAPNTWNGGVTDPTIEWCSNVRDYVPNLLTGAVNVIQTATTVGSGFSNTKKMLGGCTYGAANAVAGYNGGGKSDWHLPSKDELAQIYIQRARVTGLVDDKYYWSSSELPLDSEEAYDQKLSGNGNDGSAMKLSIYRYVRPVRAFG